MYMLFELCTSTRLSSSLRLRATLTSRLPSADFATFAQFVSAFSPNPMAASILFSTFFSFVIIVSCYARFLRP